MPKILIVDDEERVRKLVGDFLRREEFEVLTACDGQEALAVFDSFENEIDLVVLDVMMPGYDGFSVLRMLRKKSQVPVIMLTARTDESDQLFGYELGVDEYVKKPFSPQVLTARVKAVLKRSGAAPGKILHFGELTIDSGGRSVFLKKKELELSPKEYELLVYLAEHRGQALNRDQILAAVWDYRYQIDTRTVDTHIKKLRIKLEDHGHLIETVRGFGYKFTG